MTTITWVFAAAFVVAFVLFILMASLAMKHASRANEAERNLRTSRQAHALDVVALTKKMMQAVKSANPDKQEGEKP